MVKFFRTWCEEIIISSFVVSILEMLVPDGNIKKYIRVVIGVYMIFVILSPVLLKINNTGLEEEIKGILEVSSPGFNEEDELEKSFEILNTISENIEIKEEPHAREIQEQEN